MASLTRSPTRQGGPSGRGAAAAWRRGAEIGTVVAVLAASLILWEAVCRLFDVPVFLVPPPSVIAADFMKSPAVLLDQSLYTLWEAVAGFGLAVLFGVALAIAIVYSRFLEKTLYTLLVALNSVPKVAMAPLFVVWMGTGVEPKIAISLVIAIFAIVIDMVLGLRSVDPDMLDLARSLGGGPLKTLLKIRFPNALPSLFAGMKVAVALALVGAIVGEFVAANRGLGYVIMNAQGMFDTPRMFSAFALLAVLGTVLFFLVDFAERLALPWHVSRRRGGATGAAP